MNLVLHQELIKREYQSILKGCDLSKKVIVIHRMSFLQDQSSYQVLLKGANVRYEKLMNSLTVDTIQKESKRLPWHVTLSSTKQSTKALVCFFKSQLCISRHIGAAESKFTGGNGRFKDFALLLLGSILDRRPNCFCTLGHLHEANNRGFSLGGF